MILILLRLMGPAFFEKVRIPTFLNNESVYVLNNPPFQTAVEILRAVFTREDIVKRLNQPANMGR